jgi:predicted RNase H-like HicB family nuclease
MKAIYNAILLGVGEESTDVVFPDFPGCVSSGNSVQDALSNAAEALEFHLEGTLEDGLDIPDRSDDSLLRECLSENPGAQIAVVEVDIPESKTQRINICLPDFIIRKIERHLKKNTKESRSSLLAKSALKYMSHHA